MRTQTVPADAGAEALTLFREQISPRIADSDRRKFLEIDILSGDFEIDADEDAAHDRLAARRPDGHFVLMRADGSAAGHFGYAMV
jgi:hypothetical protein